MKKSIYAATLLATTLFGCSKSELPTSDESTSAQHTKITGLTSAVTYNDESAFITSLASYGFKTPTQLTYNRDAQTNYTTTYGFNIPSANRAGGFKWNSGDEDTEEWRPQGIAGFTSGGRKFILTTWYGTEPDDVPGIHNGHKGVRLAIADITNMSAITYRLILLVQPAANMSNSLLWDNLYANDGASAHNYTQGTLFAPITIHAGGVAVYGTKVYVADTGRGLRVFDLNNFISVTTGSETKCGKMTDNTIQGFNYGYILPEIGWYSITGASPYSCVELGEGTRLWFGQYLTSGTPVVTGYPLNTSGQITTTAPTTITPKDDTANTPVLRIQGVYRGQTTKTWMVTTGNSSYEGSTARLVRYNDGATIGTRYRWPHGGEDLYYESSSGFLWCLTEYETSKYGSNNRSVFAVRLTDYD